MKTTEEKAKAYDEALEKIKVLQEDWKSTHNRAWVEIEEVFPQLAESKDERIRKWLYDYISNCPNNNFAFYGGVGKDAVLNYLEKQKEQPISAEEVLARAGLKPYKDGNQWCILAGDNIQEGICGFGDTIDEALYQFLMEVLEKHKEQKPAEKQDYSGLNDLERAIHRGFLVVGVVNVPVTIIKETAQDCLAHMPAEWREEDEKMLNLTKRQLRILQSHLSHTHSESMSDMEYSSRLLQIEACVSWLDIRLKSLRLQPKAEWSKEDENKIERLAFLVSVVAEKEMISPEECIDLRRFVKSYHPQYKREWSEEDEKVYNNALDALYYKDLNNKDDVLSALKDLCDLISKKRKIIPPYARYRPSEEQKEALQRAIDCLDNEYGDHPEELDSLLNDLNKL